MPSPSAVVTDDGLLRIRQHGKVMAEIPNKALADEGPRYERPMLPPKVRRQDPRWTGWIFSAFSMDAPRRVIQEFLDADQESGNCQLQSPASACCRISKSVQPRVGVGAVRPHGAVQHHGRPGLGCRCDSRERHGKGTHHDTGRSRLSRVAHIRARAQK